MNFTKNVFPTLLVMGSTLYAGIIHTESTDSDLSDIIGSPTVIATPLALGSNQIQGTINENNGGDTTYKPDIFTFTVSEGHVLTSLTYTLSSASDISTSVHFMGFTDSTGNFGETNLVLFASLVGSVQNGENILATENDGGNAVDHPSDQPLGYQLPLPAETYTLWFQETDLTEIDYTFDFTVAQQVPEPSSVGLLALSACIMFRRKR